MCTIHIPTYISYYIPPNRFEQSLHSNSHCFKLISLIARQSITRRYIKKIFHVFFFFIYIRPRRRRRYFFILFFRFLCTVKNNQRTRSSQSECTRRYNIVIIIYRIDLLDESNPHRLFIVTGAYCGLCVRVYTYKVIFVLFFFVNHQPANTVICRDFRQILILRFSSVIKSLVDYCLWTVSYSSNKYVKILWQI